MKMQGLFWIIIFILATFFIETTAFAKARGIYISQPTLEDTKRITNIIHHAKAVGINTFVIDYSRPSKMYQKNIQLVKAAGLNYVARIVIFPGGATPAQIKSIAYREKKLNLMKQAVALGATEIQMDYIRYHSRNRPSTKNENDVNEVIKWFKQHLTALNVPLQIDVFGITSFHPELRIGQHPKIFARNVDSINPMVYPSHYQFYRTTSAHPYDTVYSSLNALKAQLKGEPPVRIIAFIEASNYRYHLSKQQKLYYIGAEINAANDANIAGWYFWSANNIYDSVFTVLAGHQNEKKFVEKSNKINTVGS